MSRTITVDVDLEEFDDQTIVDYAQDILLRRGKALLASQATDFEHLYYATRGDGPIPEPIADQVRAFLRGAVGRA